jgi:hypothetical protein
MAIKLKLFDKPDLPPEKKQDLFVNYFAGNI